MRWSITSDKKFQSLFEDLKKELSMDKLYTVVDTESKVVFNDIVQSTPVRSGLTKSSWKRTIKRSKSEIDVVYENTRVSKNGTPIVIYIKNGHYTRNGGYVRPNDFITPRTDGLTGRIEQSLGRSN